MNYLTPTIKSPEQKLEADSGFLLSNSQYATHHYTKTDIPKTHSSFLSSLNRQEKKVINTINNDSKARNAGKPSYNYNKYDDKFEYSNFEQDNKRNSGNGGFSAFSRISEIAPSMNDCMRSKLNCPDQSESLQFKFKLVLLGDYGTGKSALFRSLVNGGIETLQSVVHSSAENHALKSIILNDCIQITLDLWDTSGEEKYGQPTNQFFRDADGILLCYDITNSKSFVSLSRWINIITSNTIKSDVVLVLVGNKNDLNECREISFEDSSYFARSNHLDLIEVSAITLKNTELSLEYISRCMILALEDNNKKQPLNYLTESTDTPFNVNQEIKEKQVHESQLDIFENLFIKSTFDKFKDRASVIASKTTQIKVLNTCNSIILTKDNISRRSSRKREKSRCC